MQLIWSGCFQTSMYTICNLYWAGFFSLFELIFLIRFELFIFMVEKPRCSLFSFLAAILTFSSNTFFSWSFLSFLMKCHFLIGYLVLVWVSHFLLLNLITLLYVDFCFFYLIFITSPKKLPQWNQFWNILWSHDVVTQYDVDIMYSCE